MTEPPSSPGVFTGQTRWSRIRRLATPPADDAASRRSWEDAWDYLWETFRPAMLATVRQTLARLGGGAVVVEEAEDVVQSFLLGCLERGVLARADQGIGKFRTFVAVCLRRYTSKYVEHRRRKRRAPSRTVLHLEDADLRAPAPDELAAWEGAFEEEWVRCVLDAALPLVGARSAPNEQLLRVLVQSPGLGIDDLALRLGTDPKKVPLRLHRARRMLAEEFWRVVQQTVSNERELEEEQRRLARLLSRYLDVRGAPHSFSPPRSG